MADSAYEGAERGCYSSLVNGRGIFDSHWHYDPFVKTPRGVYCSEFYVVRVHACLKKTICHVDRSKEHAVAAVSQDF